MLGTEPKTQVIHHGSDHGRWQAVISEPDQRLHPLVRQYWDTPKGDTMSESPDSSQPNVFPFLRYHDAPAALDWLERAFGFERLMVAPGPEDTIAHAQIRLGGGVIMLSSARDDDPLGLKSPGDLGGATSQGIYVHVEDVDAHYLGARAAGAQIVIELRDMDYGSREYAARDPEGYVWSFGTYWPGEDS